MPLHQKPLRRPAPPDVGIGQALDQFRIRRLTQAEVLGQGKGRLPIWNYAINPSAVLAIVQGLGVVGLRSHPLRVFNEVPVIVD